MIDIFLSASVPLPDRDRRFFETADVLSIREAIKALVEVILPVGRITCGGHPAITPLLSLFAEDAGVDRERITVFQSAFFEAVLPPANIDFIDVRMVAARKTREASLTCLREQMIASRNFHAAVIVGGMEGIFEEVAIFQAQHPTARVLPIATTGAAAATIFREGQYDAEFETELTYSSLFRRKLLPK